MTKEEVWLQRRVGLITASELGKITSKSGRIIDGVVDYIRAKRWERKHGFGHPVTTWQMEVGNQQEPYAFKWLVANYPEFKDAVYSKDEPEIPFWLAPDCPFGASPDAYTRDESIVFEFKTLVGGKAIEFFDDDWTPYFDKKAAVVADHGEQVLGLFMSNPKVQEVWLIKYIFCDDNIIKDIDSPLAPWRGLVFKFLRKDYEKSISDMRERVGLINAMIDALMDPAEFKSGEWCLDENGKLYMK